MPKQKKNKYLRNIIDFFYSIPILLALWVYQETDNQWLSGLAFILSLGIFYLCISKYKQWKQRQLLKSDIDIVDSMPGVVFEEYVLEHLKHLGYTGRLTPTADGADIIVQKDKVKTVVQAKRWKNNVGIDAVQQTIEAVRRYGADKGIVVTNSSFTKSAEELAAGSEIELWDRIKLLELINNIVNAQNSYINKKEQVL